MSNKVRPSKPIKINFLLLSRQKYNTDLKVQLRSKKFPDCFPIVFYNHVIKGPDYLFDYKIHLHIEFNSLCPLSVGGGRSGMILFWCNDDKHYWHPNILHPVVIALSGYHILYDTVYYQRRNTHRCYDAEPYNKPPYNLVIKQDIHHKFLQNYVIWISRQNMPYPAHNVVNITNILLALTHCIDYNDLRDKSMEKFDEIINDKNLINYILKRYLKTFKRYNDYDTEFLKYNNDLHGEKYEHTLLKKDILSQESVFDALKRRFMNICKHIENILYD